MAHSHHIPSEHDLELLSAYLDGELSGREKEALEQRLALETTLSTALDDLRTTVALLGSLPRLKAPRDFRLDPAEVRAPWWTRLFHVGSTLELAGTLGAVASLAVIVLAVLLSQFSTDGEAHESEPHAASVAQHTTQTPAESDLGMATPSAPAPAGTPIVYAGEEIESTLAMQSTVWAGTPFTTPTAAPTRTPPPSPFTAQAEGYFAPSVAGDAVAEAEQPAPAPAAVAESSAPVGAAAAPESDGVALGGVAPTPIPPAANQTMMDEGADAEDVTGGAAPPETALREAPDTPDDATAAEEPSDTDSAERLETEQVSAPTGEAAAAEIAQAPGDTPPEETRAKDRTTADRDRDLWWLAGLGAVTLAFSVILIVMGRRKAHAS